MKKRFSIYAVWIALALCLCVCAASADVYYDNYGNAYSTDGTYVVMPTNNNPYPNNDPTGTSNYGQNRECIAFGHNWKETSRTASTCAKAGKIVYTCSRCGETKTQELPLSDEHSFGKWKTDEPATCKERELQYRKCKECGKTKWRYIGDLAPHTWVQTPGGQPATCGAAGTASYRCSVCGETKTEQTPPTGQHQFGPWQVKVEPRPGEPGVERRVCAVCGAAEERETEPGFDELKLTLQSVLTSPEKESYEAGDTLEFDLMLNNYSSVGFDAPDIKGEKEEITGAWTWIDEHLAPELPRGWQFKTKGRYTVTEKDAEAGVLHLRWLGSVKYRADDLPNLATHRVEAGETYEAEPVLQDFKVKPTEPEAPWDRLGLTLFGKQISEARDVYAAGDELEFRLILANDGTLPAGVGFTTAHQCTEPGEWNEWERQQGGSLAAGGSASFCYTYVVTEEDVEAGSFALSFQGGAPLTLPEEANLPADYDAEAAGLYDGVLYSNTLDFSFSTGGETEKAPLELVVEIETEEKETYDKGDVLRFLLRLRNNTQENQQSPRISFVALSPDGETLTNDEQTGEELPAGEEITCEFEYEVTQTDEDNGGVTLLWTGKTGGDPDPMKISLRSGFHKPHGSAASTSKDITVGKGPAEHKEALQLSVAQVSPEKKAYAAGDKIEFKARLRNNSTVTLDDPTIAMGYETLSGKWFSLENEHQKSLAAHSTFSHTFTYTVTEEDVKNGAFSLIWEAAAMAKSTPVKTSRIRRSFKAGMEAMSLLLEVQQTSEVKEAYGAGEELTFEAKLTNAGAASEYKPTVLMTRVYGDGQRDLIGVKSQDGIFKVAETVTFTFSYTMTQEDVERGGFNLEWKGTGLPGEPGYEKETHVPISYKEIVSNIVSVAIAPSEPEPANLALVAIQSAETVKETYAEGDQVYIVVKLMKTGEGLLDHPFILFDPDESTAFMRDVFKKADFTGGIFACADNYTITAEDVKNGSVTLTYEGCAWNAGTFEADWNVTQSNPNLVRSNKVTILLNCGAGGKSIGKPGLHWPKPSEKKPELLLSVAEDSPKTEYEVNKFGKTEDVSYTVTITNVGKQKCLVDALRITIGSLWHDEDVGKTALLPGESMEMYIKQAFLDSDVTPGTETETLIGQVSIEFKVTGIWETGSEKTEQLESNTVTFLYGLLKDEPKKGITGWTIPDATTPADVFIAKAAIGIPSQPTGFVAGDELAYLIGLNNTSAYDLDIVLTDPLNPDGETLYTGQLKAGKIRLDGFTYKITEQDAENGYVQNQAFITWTDPDSGNTIKKCSNISVTPVINPSETKGLVVTKSVLNSPKNGSYFVPGEEIEFEIKVTNPYDYEYIIVGMVDKLYPGCDTFGNFKTLYDFAKGDSETITFKYTVTDLDAALGYVENVASARAIDGKNPVQPFYSNTVQVTAGDSSIQKPELTCTKTETSHPKNDSFYQEGETIEYKITVSNIGKIAVTNVTVTDILEADPNKVIGTIADLKPGESADVLYKHVVTGDDVTALSVINAAVAHVKYHDDLPEYAVMSTSVYSQVGKEPPTPPELDLDKLVPDGPVTPGEVDKNTTNTGKTDLTQARRAKGDSCERALTAIGENASVYTQHYCSDHAKVAKAAEALVNAAVTEEQQAEAWMEVADMWWDAVHQEYDQCIAASTGTAKAAFVMEKDAFDEYVARMDEQLAMMHPDQPALVNQKIADLLRDRAAECCYEMYNAGKERKDSLFTAEPIWLDGEEEMDDCLRIDAENKNGELLYQEELCADHAFTQETVYSLMDVEMTRAARTEAWMSAQAIWQEELDVMTNEHYRQADANSRQIIAAARIAFDELLQARQATLSALYEKAPDLAAEMLCQLIQRDVMILCEGW